MSRSQPDLTHRSHPGQGLPLPNLRGTQRTGREQHGVWSRSYSEGPRPYIDLTSPHYKYKLSHYPKMGWDRKLSSPLPQPPVNISKQISEARISSLTEEGRKERSREDKQSPTPHSECAAKPWLQQSPPGISAGLWPDRIAACVSMCTGPHTDTLQRVHLCT